MRPSNHSHPEAPPSLLFLSSVLFPEINTTNPKHPVRGRGWRWGWLSGSLGPDVVGTTVRVEPVGPIVGLEVVGVAVGWR